MHKYHLLQNIIDIVEVEEAVPIDEFLDFVESNDLISSDYYILILPVTNEKIYNEVILIVESMLKGREANN